MQTTNTIANKAAAAAAVLVFFCANLMAAISSGGDYELLSSVTDNGGGMMVAGGEYAARGAVGQRLPGDDGVGIMTGGGYVNREGFYNPPHFTYQKALGVQVETNISGVTMILPPNAVDKEVFDIIVNKDPVNNPLIADPECINSANMKMEANEGVWSKVMNGNLAETTLFDEQDYWTNAFRQRGMISMAYNDANNDGILDGSFPPIRVDSLAPWSLDLEDDSWVKVAGSFIDTNSKVIMAPFPMPGVYAILGSIDNSVKDTYAYPVPYRPNGPNKGDGLGQSGTEAGGITFKNIPQIGNIEIYTIDGRLVKKISIPANLPVAKINWDVKNASGEKVVSGTYIWRIVSGSNTKTGKLMVIR